MSNVFYCGIDPGNSGAICLVDDVGNYVSASVMPSFAKRPDPGALYRLLDGLFKDRVIRAFLEQPIAMPKQSSVSTLSTGINFGFCEMALAALGVRYELVPAKKWQKDMHSGIAPSIKDPKLRSALKVQRLMGLDRFMVRPKSKKPHDGLIDAFLIALYGQRLGRKSA